MCEAAAFFEGCGGGQHSGVPREFKQDLAILGWCAAKCETVATFEGSCGRGSTMGPHGDPNGTSPSLGGS
eukprot:2507462-Pyramimonas_sp.AAC.1